MKCFVRLVICVLVVSSPAQSWAAPMLCETGMESHSAALDHSHDGNHEHHTDTHHDSATHDPASTHDQSSSECTTDCECSDCVVTVALSDSEHVSVVAYRGERMAMCDTHDGLYVDNIFRPPISG